MDYPGLEPGQSLGEQSGTGTGPDLDLILWTWKSRTAWGREWRRRTSLARLHKVYECGLHATSGRERLRASYVAQVAMEAVLTRASSARHVRARVVNPQTARRKSFYMNLKFYGVSACSQIRRIPYGGAKSPSPAYLNFRYGGVEPEGFVGPAKLPSLG
ncbi:hypothetical protein Bbelb_071900 [Branchiostoma belcheri]|nr:hypothetical protein Bbelb_071900 [Branchiostoma belcheri]